MADIKEIQQSSRADAETVEILKEALRQAEAGVIVGIITITKYKKNGMIYNFSASMGAFESIGMLYHTMNEMERTVDIDPNGPETEDT